MPNQKIQTDDPAQVVKFPRAADTGGGDGGGGDFGMRVAKLQSDVEHVQSDITELKADIRALLYGGIGAVILLFAAIVGGGMWIVDVLRDFLAPLAR